MSMCITDTCAHGRDVFIWVADGPWLGDASDPDHGRYPWVHATSSSPGHLEVCDAKPFATAKEAGEVCACGHDSRSHPPSGEVPPAPAVAARAMPCTDCGCPDFRHRAADLERARAAGQTGIAADEERLMRGEPVPGAPGACSREGCAHAATRHRAPGAYKKGACSACRCPGWSGEPGALMPPEPDTQLDLFGGEADIRPSRRRRGPRRYTAETVPVTGGLL